MTNQSLEQLCESGQRLLMEMRYLEAEAVLVRAEALAIHAGDWDTLSRLYMPLQEVRRQRRQRCGEGIVCLDLLAEGPNDCLDARHVLENYPHGQLLVAGWGTIEPALAVRRMAAQHGLYVETFLAATYPTQGGRLIVIVPLEDARLPEPRIISSEAISPQLPPNCLALREDELPRGSRKGTFQTYGQVMTIWERLHRPFLAEADAQSSLLRKTVGYRKTIQVDYACELAHQQLSDVARDLARDALAQNDPAVLLFR